MQSFLEILESHMVWFATAAVIFHVSLAFYICLVVKDSFKLSAKTKSFLMYLTFLVPVVGVIVALFMVGNNKQYNGYESTSSNGSGYFENVERELGTNE